MPTTTIDIEKLSVIYDRIYDIADRLFKKYNPCKIHSKNGKSRCTCHPNSTYRVYLCCSDCKYISPTGCTVKCLGCKLFMCNAIQEQYSILYSKLNKLHAISYRHNLPGGRFWCPKEKWLKDRDSFWCPME